MNDALIKKYVDVAIQEEINKVQCEKGNRSNTINASAFVLGTLVSSSWANIPENTVKGLLLEAARLSGLTHKESISTINSGMTSGMREPRPNPFTDEHVIKQKMEQTPPPVESELVVRIWNAAKESTLDNPYLTRKDVNPVETLREISDVDLKGIIGYVPICNKGMLKGRILVARLQIGDTITSCEFIDENGLKSAIKGCVKKDAYWLCQPMENVKRIYISEGIATAISVRLSTNDHCVAALSNTNLLGVAQSMREEYPTAEIVIVADLMKSNNEPDTYAVKAADMVGCLIAIPDFTDSERETFRTTSGEIPNDFNDLYVLRGCEKTLESLLKAVSGEDKKNMDELKAVFCNEFPDKFEDPDSVIQNMIATRTLSVIYGEGNSGKTFFALSLAAAVSSGKECYGKKVDQGLVIYLATEAPSTVRGRIQAIKKFYGYSLDNLVFVPVPINFHKGDDDSNKITKLCETVTKIRKSPVKMIFADTLARISSGANENSGEDMLPIITRFENLAYTTNAAVVIIHHSGKDSTRGARGWSGVRDFIDTEIHIVEQDNIRSATVTKQRALSNKGEIIKFKLEKIEMGVDKFRDATSTCVAVPDNMPSNKRGNNDQHQRTFERAWRQSGEYVVDGKPFITLSDLKRLLQNDGLKPRDITAALNPANTDKMIGYLINTEIVSVFKDGWLLLDQNQANAMMIR